MRTTTGTASGTTARIAATTSRHRRARFEKRPAVGVVALVRQRRQELVQQIAVRGVHFEHSEPGGHRPDRGGAERGEDRGDAVDGQRLRLGIAGRERDRARRHHVGPAAGVGRHQAGAVPRALRARLAAGVRQLHARHGALRLDEAGDALQHRDVRVVPDAEVLGADAPLGHHRRGFGENQPGTADGELAEVHQVPVAGEAVLARVLAHRRDADAVAQGGAAQGQRGKELRHGDGLRWKRDGRACHDDISS